MFEICALLASKKTPKARKASGPRVAAGASVTVQGLPCVVVARDAKYANAWTVRCVATGRETSVSRDMIVVA